MDLSEDIRAKIERSADKEEILQVVSRLQSDGDLLPLNALGFG
jgi:hypothetical protein